MNPFIPPDNSMIYTPNPLTDPGLSGPIVGAPAIRDHLNPPGFGTPWGGGRVQPAPPSPLPLPSPYAPSFSFDPGRFKENELPQAIKDLLALPVSHFEATARAPRADEQPLTNVAFLLDRSSSMAPYADATIDGFNAQRKVVKAGAKLAGKTRFTETYFADQVEIRRTAVSLRNLAKLDRDTYKPGGCTALYDALGDTIAALLGTKHIEGAATATLVTLFTDGEENASRRYSPSVLGQLIKRLEATGRWTFALVGPSGSVQGLASLLSVRPANVAAYTPTSAASRQEVFGQIAAANTSYMALRAAGESQSACLYAGSPTPIPAD